LPKQAADTASSWHLYVIQVGDARHLESFESLRQAGIGVNLHYIPVHTQPFYRAMGFAPGMFPVAEAYYARAISIPLYFGLTDAAQDKVVAALTRIL
jgi:dTDP-4-amino-4,6-dideoxygalactose transaminase